MSGLRAALHRASAAVAPRVPRLAGIAAYVIAVTDLSALFLPPFHHAMAHRLDHVPGVVTGSSILARVGTGVVFLLLADALSRRKRRAWLFAVAAATLNVVVHIAILATRHHALALPGIPSSVMLALLVVGRRQFDVGPDRRSLRRAARVLGSLLAVDAALGLGLCLTRTEQLEVPLTWRLYARTLASGLVGVESPLTAGAGTSADIAYYALLALGLATLVAALTSLLSSARYEGHMGKHDQARVHDLVSEHGERDSLAYFALRDDKAVVWAPSGRACITYRATLGVMLASGDPIGLQSAWPDAIAEFMAMARANGWLPAAGVVSQAGAHAWRSATGMNVLEIGDEAVVDLTAFSLEGREMKNVRNMVTRATRRGYTTDVRRASEIPDGELAELRLAARVWRHGGTERGYSMALGRIGDPRDAMTVVGRVFDDGRLVAFNTYVPWGARGASLDFMRRAPECESGVNELLITALAEHHAELGIDRVSLNFALFRSVIDRGEQIGAGAISRFNRNVLVLIGRWFQIDTLFRFNAKFKPQWVPRYFVYPDGRSFVHVGLAFLEAEGFLPALSRRRALTPADLP